MTMFGINEIMLICFLELIVRWATDYQEFRENELAAVELVTDSYFEAAEVSIIGSPKQIPDDHHERDPSLVVPGPDIPGKPRVKYCGDMYGCSSCDGMEDFNIPTSHYCSHFRFVCLQFLHWASYSQRSSWWQCPSDTYVYVHFNYASYLKG